MLSSAAAVGSAFCRRREQAALDCSALSELDRGSERGSETTTRGGSFECSVCIVQFLSSRKPVLELHLLMVSESVASYRARGRSGVGGGAGLRRCSSRGLQQRRGWVMCFGSAAALGKQTRLQSALLLLVFGYSSGDLQRRGSAGESECGIFNWRRQW